MKRVLSFTMLLSLMILQSCSENSADSAEGSFDPIAVKFSNGTITRASGVDWAQYDRIGIYMFTTGNITTPYEYDGVTYANIQYYNELENGTVASFEPVHIDEEIFYTSDDEAVDFVASYPYNEALTSTNFIYPLDMSDQSDKPAIDFMTAYITDTNTQLEAIEFTFNHILSQLTFVIKSGEGAPGLEGLAITMRGLVNSGTYDIMNRSLALGAATSELSVVDSYAIVLPQTADVVFHVTTTDSPEGFDTEATSITFESGKTTEVTLTLNRDKVLFTGASTIVDWVENPDIVLEAEQVVAFSTATSLTSGDGTTPDNLYTSSDPNIGIFMFDETTSYVVNKVANIEYAATDEGVFEAADSSETIYYPQGYQFVDFVAYSPYGSKVGYSDYTYELETDEDFMLADKLDNRIISDTAQEFSFNHMMSQLVVSVSSGIGSPSLDGLEITVNGVYSAATCDIRDDELEITTTGTTTSVSIVEGVEKIIVPQAVSLTFTIKTDENSVGFTSALRSFEFSSGETTSVALTLNLSDVDFNGASTITPWVDVEYNDGDKVDLF